MPSYWRNETDYDFTEGLTHERWAWEFLRRNSEYRRDWHERFSDQRIAPMAPWCLFAYVDPQDDDPEDDLLFYRGMVVGRAGPLERVVLGPLQDYAVVIEFDLRRPLDLLLAGAGDMLSDLQREYEADKHHGAIGAMR